MPLARRFTFRHPTLIEIGGCPIGLAPSLKYLDVSKLEQAERAEIEVGVIEGTCCSRTVRATVEKGLVTSITSDGCADRKDGEPLHPELRKLLNAAVREAKKKKRPGRATSLPVPVKKFLAKPAALVEINCYCICIFGSICYICCGTPDDPSKYSCSPW